MNNVTLKLQQQFFNKSDHQYDPKLILKPPVHTFLETKALLDALNHLPIKTQIVDFGAGSGRVTIPLLQNGFSVFSIDISDSSLKNLQKVAKNMSLALPKIGLNLPKNKTFSAIVGADILHHINLDEYLPLFHASLKKNGVVVFSEPCAFNPSWYAFLPFASEWEVEKGLLQCSYFNLKKKFKKHGFSQVKISGFGLLPRPLFLWSKSLCRLNDTYGDIKFCKLFAYRYIIKAWK